MHLDRGFSVQGSYEWSFLGLSSEGIVYVSLEDNGSECNDEWLFCEKYSPISDVMFLSFIHRQINAQASWAWAQGTLPNRAPRCLEGRHGGERGQRGADETCSWVRPGMHDLVGHGCWVPGSAWGRVVPEPWK